LIGFVPPSQFGQSNRVEYAAAILAGILVIGVVPPVLLDRLRKPGWKADT
jgi:glutamate:GABA antiporter